MDCSSGTDDALQYEALFFGFDGNMHIWSMAMKLVVMMMVMR